MMRIALIVTMSILPGMLASAQDSPHGPLRWKCAECHTTEGWKGPGTAAHFDHASTPFVLYGQHRTTACRECHVDVRFTGTSMQCVACHRKEYETAIAVDHRAAAFGMDCEQCHNVKAESWRASFDHNRTQFPTRGIHDAVPCTACHAGKVYRGTRTECVACHRAEYDAAADPKHSTAGFGTDCAMCHRALTWKPAAFFPHGYFPIGSGDTHRPGRWNSCADCHASSPNYTIFECINCHTHSKGATDSHHGDVRGYVYQSSSCYRCHPTGGG